MYDPCKLFNIKGSLPYETCYAYWASLTKHYIQPGLHTESTITVL